MNRRRLALVQAIATIVAVALLARYFGLTEYLRPENLGVLRQWISSLGPAGPLVFVLGYAAATVAFLPGTPLTLLGGLLFGALLGTIYAAAGATIGLTIAFLLARYAARDLVAGWVRGNARLRRLDDGVERQGWRILVVTRLVPLFPFSLQNYAYGLTRVGLATYVLASGICIIPGTAVYAFAGGSLGTLSAGGDISRVFIYLGVAAVIFVGLSLLPGAIRRRYSAPGLEDADGSDKGERE